MPYRPTIVTSKKSLLARIAAKVLGTGKPKPFAIGVSSSHKKVSPATQEWLQARAKAKRVRRAALYTASNYAKGNVNA